MRNKEFNPNGVIPDNGNYFGMPLTADEAALVLISAPWDATMSLRAGSSYAPDAIIDASRHIDFHEPLAPDAWRKGIATAPIDYTIQDISHRLRHDAERVIKIYEEFGASALENMIYARRLRKVNEGSATVNEKIYSQAKHWLDRGKLVGLVGGDQSVTYGMIRAVGERYGKVGILHIDAGSDLKEGDHGFDHSHRAIIHNLLRDVEAIERVVMVGMRECSPREWQRIEEDERIEVFTGQSIWTQKFEGTPWMTISNAIVEKLPQSVYISLDIDGLTIECTPNAGALVPGGIRFMEVVYLLGKIVESGRRIVGFDLTEVVPDMEDKTDAIIAARMLYKMCCMALKRYDAPNIL